jgi:hypothetical protein
MNEAVEIVIEEQTEQPAEQTQNRANLDQIPPIEMEETFLDENAPEVSSLTIKVTPTGARLEREDDPSFFKNISLKSLARAIMDDASIDTGFLPLYGQNYIGIRRYLQFRDSHVVFIEASAGKRLAIYDANRDTREEYIIPHPYSLMAIKLKELSTGKFKVVASRMYAMSAPLFSDTAQLYRFPYGNVYSDGRICWGGYQSDVDRKRYNNILQSGELVDLFLNTGYNDDLFYRDSIPTPGLGSFRDVYNEMSTKEDYPYDTMQAHLTFSEALSLMKNN